MYTTIEADIRNGVVCGEEARELPSHAHVFITLIREPVTAAEMPAKAKRLPSPAIYGKAKIHGDLIDSAPASA